MRKAILIGGTVFLGVVAFMACLVVVINSQGGLKPSHAGLARVPVVGSLLNVRGAPEEEAVQEAAAEARELPADRDVPFLRLGSEARLQTLAEELGVKKAEYELALSRLERRSRELDAWERQLKKERDELRQKFNREKEDLARLRTECDQRQTDLDALQIAIEQAEKSNLKKMAEIYSKMDAERASEILTEMYSADQQETVVKIVYLMEGRSAAKVLGAITDSKVGADITERLKRVMQTGQEGNG